MAECGSKARRFQQSKSNSLTLLQLLNAEGKVNIGEYSRDQLFDDTPLFDDKLIRYAENLYDPNKDPVFMQALHNGHVPAEYTKKCQEVQAEINR